MGGLLGTWQVASKAHLSSTSCLPPFPPTHSGSEAHLSSASCPPLLVFHKNHLWYQKGWRLLPYIIVLA